MTLKHYILEDLSELSRIEAWVGVAAHRAQLFRAESANTVYYRIVVEDNPHLAACSPLFESEFGDSVRAEPFPE